MALAFFPGGHYMTDTRDGLPGLEWEDRPLCNPFLAVRRWSRTSIGSNADGRSFDNCGTAAARREGGGSYGTSSA